MLWTAPPPGVFAAVHMSANDAVDGASSGTPQFERSSNQRKKAEMRFAHLKVHHGFERMRLRGLTGARDEFHLAAIVQNLKTLALRSIGPPAMPQFACATGEAKDRASDY